MSIWVFWIVTLCVLVSRYQRFGGKYCLNFQGTLEDTLYKARNCLSIFFIIYSPYRKTYQMNIENLNENICYVMDKIFA
jgi:hypothetical protein